MQKQLTRFRHAQDLHQSSAYAGLMHFINWKVEKHEGVQIFIRPLGIFSIAKIQRPSSLDWQWLRSVRRRHRTLITYVEPSLAVGELTQGIRVEPLAHSQSSLIDLTLSENELLKSFSQKTRYNITRNLKKGTLTLRSIPLSRLSKKDKQAFFSLHERWSKKRYVVGYPVSLLNGVFTNFAANGRLHLSYVDKELVGALLILYTGKVATYYAALADKAGYANFAPTLLTWDAALKAKRKGCTIFDFGGTYDPRYPKMYKRWQGFTKFKEGFKPTPITYPPTRLLFGW